MWYLSGKTFLYKEKPDSIEKISVFDGTTGRSFTVSGREEIEYIVGNIKSNRMKRDGISLGYKGYSFDLDFIDKDGKTVSSFIINSENTIRDDPFFYRCDGTLCFDYLAALEKEALS